jgi:hypothetical protein
MGQSLAWHAPKSGCYHVRPDCPIGRYVAPRYRVGGTGGKQPCAQCRSLESRRFGILSFVLVRPLGKGRPKA